MKAWIAYNRVITAIDLITVGPILILMGWVGRRTGWNEGPAQCWVMRNLCLPGWYPKGHLITFEELQQMTGRLKRKEEI